jgi:8-oxo-dGTP pyrophosphatase MutT (NUDIX family)
VLLDLTVAAIIVGLAAAAQRALGWPMRSARAAAAEEAQARKWSSAGGIVSNASGEIAIVLQRGRKKTLRWTLPKGRIDAGESPETAALREVYEETGLRARIVRPLGVHEGARHFTHYFEMMLVSDDGVHDDETKEVRFVSLTEAVRQIESPRDLTVLRRFVALRIGVVTH